MNCMLLSMMMEFGTPKVMDDVKEEQHGLLRLDHGDQPRLYPLSKVVYGNRQVRIALGPSLERSDHIEPLDRKWPHDGDCLECLGRQVGLLSVVLTPFAGAHNLFSVGYCGWPVESLSEHISDQASTGQLQ